MSEKHLPGIGGAFDRIVFDGDGTAWVPERTCEPNTFLADAGENWGRWVTECGECGAVLHETYTSKVRVLPNYCPCCGAKVMG